MNDEGLSFENTDVELFREKPNDAYSPSLHVTREGSIGINVGGRVHVMSLSKWHQLASEKYPIKPIKQ